MVADTKPYDVEVFFDGACPLCVKDIGWMKWLDRKGQRIRFTDISLGAFSPETYGLTMDELMEKLHGRLPDGRWVYGVEVFRQLYLAVGFRRLVRLSRIRPIDGLLRWGYRLFAKNRLRLTGRCESGTCAIRQL